jgi:hypothetical protein
MSRVLLASVLVLLVAAGSGCTRYYWSRSGATAEQFDRDSRDCADRAVRMLGLGAATDAVEQVYRSCLQGRGYVRDQQVDPPPPGFYRGFESSEAFAEAATRAWASGQGFEQELARLDDLKARGRITDEEYATMRRKLVEGVTPATLAPPLAAAATPAPDTLAGRWYGSDRSVLDIRTVGGRQLEWEWELSTDRTSQRANGSGSVAGDQISLVGRITGYQGSTQTVTFTLTRESGVLRGSSNNANNLPRAVVFRRERR